MVLGISLKTEGGRRKIAPFEEAKPAIEVPTQGARRAKPAKVESEQVRGRRLAGDPHRGKGAR